MHYYRHYFSVSRFVVSVTVAFGVAMVSPRMHCVTVVVLEYLLPTIFWLKIGVYGRLATRFVGIFSVRVSCIGHAYFNVYLSCESPTNS